MRGVWRRPAAGLTFILLVGCNGMIPFAGSDSLEGAVLEIRRVVPYGAEMRSVWFQNGRPVTLRAQDVWNEACRLVFAMPPERAGEIRVGARYRVMEVRSLELPVGRNSFQLDTTLRLQTLAGTPLDAIECERRIEYPLPPEEPHHLRIGALRRVFGEWIAVHASGAAESGM